MFFQAVNLFWNILEAYVRDISLLDRRTDGTDSSPSGVSKDLNPVPLFTGTKLEQHTANIEITRPNSERRTQAMASLRVCRGPNHIYDINSIFN